MTDHKGAGEPVAWAVVDRIGGLCALCFSEEEAKQWRLTAAAEHTNHGHTSPGYQVKQLVYPTPASDAPDRQALVEEAMRLLRNACSSWSDILSHKEAVLPDDFNERCKDAQAVENAAAAAIYRLAAIAAASQPVKEVPAGEVVVTKNEAGQIVAVTRQDAEGKILSVIAGVCDSPTAVAELRVAADGSIVGRRLGSADIGPTERAPMNCGMSECRKGQGLPCKWCDLSHALDFIDKAIGDYIEGYRFEGDGGVRVPTGDEIMLITDAIMGLLVDQPFIDGFVRWQERVRSEGAKGGAR